MARPAQIHQAGICFVWRAATKSHLAQDGGAVRSHSRGAFFSTSRGSCMTSTDTRPAPAPSEPAWRFGFFPQLDGFRGVSILFVLIGHLLLRRGDKLGALGVCL